RPGTAGARFTVWRYLPYFRRRLPPPRSARPLENAGRNAAASTPLEVSNTSMSLEFSQEATKKIEALCERYPSKQPVILAALHLAQKEFGCLSDDALRLVAKTLDLPYPHVFGVATFYTMFRREPAGKNVIRVCTNISC